MAISPQIPEIISPFNFSLKLIHILEKKRSFGYPHFANFNSAVRKIRLLASAPDPSRSKSEPYIRRDFSTYYYCDLSDEFLIFYETMIIIEIR